MGCPVHSVSVPCLVPTATHCPSGLIAISVSSQSAYSVASGVLVGGSDHLVGSYHFRVLTSLCTKAPCGSNCSERKSVGLVHVCIDGAGRVSQMPRMSRRAASTSRTQPHGRAGGTGLWLMGAILSLGQPEHRLRLSQVDEDSPMNRDDCIAMGSLLNKRWMHPESMGRCGSRKSSGEQ